MSKLREAVKNVPELAAQFEDVAQSLCSSATSASSSSSKTVPEALEPAIAMKPSSPMEEAPASAAPAKKANRCQMCKKRVGLTGKLQLNLYIPTFIDKFFITGFTCRCGGLYCGEHRYDSAHECDFDYKTMEREEIRKNNQRVIADKIARI